MIFLFAICAEMTSLTYLARHQSEDGSWGAVSCACPKSRPRRPERVNPDAARKADALVKRLESNDIEVREEAQRALETLGTDAIPALLDALDQDPDEETKARCDAALRSIEDPDRSRLETTALALLAFFGAGYSHRSKETHDDLCYGDVIKKGLIWLICRQGPDGAYSADARENAIASLALAEAFRLTQSMLFKDQVDRAAAYLREHLSREPRARFWQALALRGTPVRFEGDDPWSLAGAAFVERSEAKARMLTALEPSVLEPELLLAVTIASFRAFGPRHRWGPAAKSCLVPGQNASGCARGSWEECPKTTALNAMTLEIYYRYASALVAGDEGPMFRKDATEADHNESDDD